MATTLDLREQVQDLLGRIQWPTPPQQHVQAPAPMPTSKFPYYHNGINFDIRDAREEKLLSDILAMDYTAIAEVIRECQLASSLDYPCMREHWHSVKVRAMTLRIHQLKQAGQFEPPATLGDIIQGVARGWIIGDEFAKRVGW